MPCVELTVTALAGTFDWEMEVDISFLKEEAVTVKPFNMSQLPKGTAFLLTGATGFLGRFVLWELVNHECCGLVYCLARRNQSEPSVLLYMHTVLVHAQCRR